MNKYFLYVRKSTDVEDKQVRSIDDQLAVLRALAKEEKIEIVAEFVEKQSAKKPGRPVFMDMLSRIEKGEAGGIVCWKLDRLARNPIDGGQISWMLQKGIVQHIRTYERGYYPQDNVLIMSVEFGMANQYILDLRANTKRGLMEKVKRGKYVSLAPIGYINDVRTKLVVVDKKKAKIVREAYELYAENNSMLEDLSRFFAKNGIFTRGGKLLKRDQISWILSNSFYYGLFKYAGELYEGNHETIISKKLFDKVQQVLKLRSKPQKPRQEPLGLCGLVRCGNCNMMVTGAKHVKRQKNGNVHEYFYYHCTRKSKTIRCSEPIVREEVLDAQLSEELQKFALPTEWAKELRTIADKDEQATEESSSMLIQETKQEVQAIDIKIQRLLTVYLEQDIDRDTYQSQKTHLLALKKSLEEKISDLQYGIHSWIKPLQEWIKDAENMEQIATSPSLNLKNILSKKIFGLNLFLHNRAVRGVPVKPWEYILAAKQKTP